MKVSYYGLFGIHTEEFTGIFREVRTDTTLCYEYYSREGTWVRDSSLARYAVGGEIGAVEISEEQARSLIARLDSIT